jgi:pyruvate dehydrogenase E2 component (dihydrolipoamide acetyltransferase)
MTNGIVSNWYKKEGEAVTKGEPLVEVDSEKVVYDVESPADGVLQKIVAPEGEEVPVAGVLGLITVEDEVLPEEAVTKGRGGTRCRGARTHHSGRRGSPRGSRD